MNTKILGGMAAIGRTIGVVPSVYSSLHAQTTRCDAVSSFLMNERINLVKPYRLLTA